jgi:phosphoribosylglycinamide formyltransferase-1
VNRRLGVLISWRGSNLQALVDAIGDGRLDATISLVISSRADAPGLGYARRVGIEALCLDHRAASSRDEHDRSVARALKDRDVGLVCLAGYMRLIGAPLLEAFPDAILNIHPSLLPAFPGIDAPRQALDHGVKVAGVTVHLVTSELDNGPIVVQRTVPVMQGDTPETLSARILVEEHRAYAEAVETVLNGGWRIDGRRFVSL